MVRVAQHSGAPINEKSVIFEFTTLTGKAMSINYKIYIKYKKTIFTH